MQATDMEAFLQQVQQMDANLQKLGHMGPELRAWGVLDSVLRMMPRTEEILNQPDRFLAYFVSPAPPIDNIKRQEGCIDFDLPISSVQYPLVTRYLSAAMESLPLYNGHSLATCRWEDIRVSMNWSTDQKSLIGETDLGHSLNPELMRSVLATLEKHSKELEEKNRELQARNEALLSAQKKNYLEKQQFRTVESAPIASPLLSLAAFESCELPHRNLLRQNIAKMGDYMVRAQQLVTLLVAQGRMTPQVKEAMRRVDWDRVQKQFPETMQECREILVPDPEIKKPLESGETRYV